MQQTDILRRLMLSTSLTAVLALGAVSASAQTTTSATSTTSTTCPTAATATATATPTTTSAQAGVLTTAAQAPKGGATAAMVQEACQRQRARTAKFVNCGVPEVFGSEEPFTFAPNTPCS